MSNSLKKLSRNNKLVLRQPALSQDGNEETSVHLYSFVNSIHEVVVKGSHEIYSQPLR